MNSGTLNKKIADLDGNEEYTVKGLESSGKCIPYIGWFWRQVDFDSEIWLGYTDETGFDFPMFVGFMENNKWGYPEFKCTPEQTDQIKSLLVEAVESPCNETLQKAFDYIQSLRPTKGGKHGKN